MLRRKNEKQNEQIGNLIAGMTYMSEQELYNMGYSEGIKSVQFVEDFCYNYNRLSDKPLSEDDQVKINMINSASTASRLLFDCTHGADTNLIIPRGAISKDLEKILEPLSITDGFIDGMSHALVLRDEIEDKRKSEDKCVDYDELRDALINCGVTEPDEAIKAMIESKKVFSNKEIEIVHF